MYCPNDAGKLVAVDNDKLLSQTSQAEYWTHQCPTCKIYWHLHLSGSEVVLIATKSDTFASKVKGDLKIVFSDRLAALSESVTIPLEKVV